MIGSPLRPPPKPGSRISTPAVSRWVRRVLAWTPKWSPVWSSDLPVGKASVTSSGHLAGLPPTASRPTRRERAIAPGSARESVLTRNDSPRRRPGPRRDSGGVFITGVRKRLACEFDRRCREVENGPDECDHDGAIIEVFEQQDPIALTRVPRIGAEAS